MLYCVQSMCVVNHHGEKRLVIQYVGGGYDSEIKCVDYRGRQLWKIIDPPLDGIPFRPLGICTDGHGNIFTIRAGESSGSGDNARSASSNFNRCTG